MENENSNENLNLSELVFTPSAVIELLMNINELSEYDIEATETSSGIELKVGDSQYLVQAGSDNVVEAPQDVVDNLSEANESGYNDIVTSDTYNVSVTRDVDNGEAVESGIIKELAKSLLLGGAVRLATKMLK